MKKIVLLMFFSISISNLFAQNQQKKENVQRGQRDVSDIYELFPTQNIWTFIKLNTRNGKMWQVQYSVKENGVVSEINSIPLVLEESEINGRFTLCPTENIWTFILLDQISGDMWQIQWSNEDDKRGIVRTIK